MTTSVSAHAQCYTCKAAESEDKPLFGCSTCRSVLYCSKLCQKENWKEHKTICKKLNVGWGAMQVRSPHRDQLLAGIESTFDETESSLGDDGKLFFKLFRESTLEGSQGAARKMKKLARRQTRHNQKVLLLHSLYLLLRTDSALLLWPSSPLLVMLQVMNSNALSGFEREPGQISFTPLHNVAYLADPGDSSTQENQVILGRQLIEHGVNVNAVTYREGALPLHLACVSHVATNLDFIQLLLEKGANPNSQDSLGRTPLMWTIPMAPSAANSLLVWDTGRTTDVNIVARSGAVFLAMVVGTIKHFAAKVAQPEDNPDRLEHKFLLKQWRDIEDMLVERGAVITAVEYEYRL